MKPWDAFFIDQQEYWISRNGTSIVSDHIEQTEDFLRFHKVDGREIRYTIRKPTGIVSHTLYSTHTTDECAFCPVNPTRQYLRKLDETYFKFYDDAEEVLKNIIIFLKWLPTVNKMDLPKKTIKKIMDRNMDYLRDVPSSPDWEARKALVSSLPVKRRSDLKGIDLYNQNELDLMQSKNQ